MKLMTLRTQLFLCNILKIALKHSRYWNCNARKTRIFVKYFDVIKPVATAWYDIYTDRLTRKGLFSNVFIRKSDFWDDYWIDPDFFNGR